jgi:hypothetical protein
MLSTLKLSRWPLLLLLAPIGLSAQMQDTNRQSSQQQQSQQTQQSDKTYHTSKQEVSDLEKANLARVAAAPAQLREVLVKDPGLMVELKRWVAKEASNDGQIVSDADLTDDAIFDRLTTDIVFRSVATRLVQRYGYLRPAINPDSDMGKEQELLIKERVRHLVQIESQEDSDTLKPQTPGTTETSAVPCESTELSQRGPASVSGASTTHSNRKHPGLRWLAATQRNFRSKCFAPKHFEPAQTARRFHELQQPAARRAKQSVLNRQVVGRQYSTFSQYPLFLG